MDTFTATDELDCLAAYEVTGLSGYRHLASKNRSVVVFIHGLGGRSHGKKRTWINLPDFLWDDVPEVDIAFHSYITLFSRLRFWRSYPLREEAKALADHLALMSYSNIILIGHSLGGVLARLALKQLHDCVFRLMPPLIPPHGGHPFRVMPAGDSAAWRPPP
jgi:pimeloyl-ACP methyl ester carboxylesterase